MARRAVPTSPVREARMSRNGRLKIEGGVFFYSLALTDRGVHETEFSGRFVGCTRRHGALPHWQSARYLDFLLVNRRFCSSAIVAKIESTSRPAAEVDRAKARSC
jgi:hypothetical protein